MLRYIFFGVLLLVASVLLIAGFRGDRFKNPPIEIFPDMVRQPKYKAQAETDFFADGRIDRALPSGTVPLQAKVDDPYYMTGVMDDAFGDGLPVPVTEQLLVRGRDRFNINCAPCHGAAGGGDGVTTKFGLNGPANYHTDRLLQMPDGQIFYTISHGKGQMIGLPHIPVRDRWAIVSYIRVLQKSQRATLADVPEESKKELSK